MGFLNDGLELSKWILEWSNEEKLGLSQFILEQEIYLSLYPV